MSEFVTWSVIVLIAAVLLAFAGFGLPLEFLFWIVVGWVGFLMRVIPQISVNWIGIATALVALVVLTLGTHGMARWYYAQAMISNGDTKTRPVWRAKWTAGLLAVVFVMFVAGIAGIGVAHQSVWLFAPDERIVHSGRTGCFSVGFQE